MPLDPQNLVRLVPRLESSSVTLFQKHVSIIIIMVMLVECNTPVHLVLIHFFFKETTHETEKKLSGNHDIVELDA